jgi:hypothetical protein
MAVPKISSKPIFRYHLIVFLSAVLYWPFDQTNQLNFCHCYSLQPLGGTVGYCNGPNRFDKLRILIYKIISTKYFKYR